jgi:hypothetical protein
MHREPDDQNPLFGCGEKFAQHDTGIAGRANAVWTAADHLDIAGPCLCRAVGGYGLE